MSQPIRALFMVRPAMFAYNPQTASTNSFQFPNEKSVHESACREFDAVVDQLRAADFVVELSQDDPASPLPDSIFPNNWFSTHNDGRIILYPMMAENRRAERKPAVISNLADKYHYNFRVDFSHEESRGNYLEGTGSIVFDHDQKIAFASISPRTDREILLKVCETLGYLPFVFSSYDRQNAAVYHTNVMMALGHNIAVCCFESIHDRDDQYGIRKLFQLSGKDVVEISLAQMESFAGNMLFIRNPIGRSYVAVSDSAWNSLSEKQKQVISSHAQPIIAKIPTIEKHGGGSIRCMIAELY